MTIKDTTNYNSPFSSLALFVLTGCRWKKGIPGLRGISSPSLFVLTGCTGCRRNNALCTDRCFATRLPLLLSFPLRTHRL